MASRRYCGHNNITFEANRDMLTVCSESGDSDNDSQTKAQYHRRRRRDATRQLSRIGVAASAVCIGHNWKRNFVNVLSALSLCRSTLIILLLPPSSYATWLRRPLSFCCLCFDFFFFFFAAAAYLRGHSFDRLKLCHMFKGMHIYKFRSEILGRLPKFVAPKHQYAISRLGHEYLRNAPWFCSFRLLALYKSFTYLLTYKILSNEKQYYDLQTTITAAHAHLIWCTLV